MGKYKQYEYTFKDYLEDRAVQASDFNNEDPFVHSRWENVQSNINDLFANPKAKNGLTTLDQALEGLREVSKYLHDKVNLFLGKESLDSFTDRLFNNKDKKTGKYTFSRRECMRRVLNDPEIIDFIHKKFSYIEEVQNFVVDEELKRIISDGTSKAIIKLMSSKIFIEKSIDVIFTKKKIGKNVKISAENLVNELTNLFDDKLWREAAGQVLAEFAKTKKSFYKLDGATVKDLLAKIYRQLKINIGAKQHLPNLDNLMYLIREKKYPQKKYEMEQEIERSQYKKNVLKDSSKTSELDDDDREYLRRFRAAIKQYYEQDISSMFTNKNEWYRVLQEDLATIAINIDTDTNNFMFSIGDIADMQMFTKGVDPVELNKEIREKFEQRIKNLVQTIPDKKRYSIQENNAWARTKKNSDELLAFGEDRRIDTRIRESFKKSRAIQTFRGADKFSISDMVIYNDNTGEFARVQAKNYQTAYQKFLGLEDKTKGGGMTVGLMSRKSMPFTEFETLMNNDQSMLKSKDYRRLRYLAANLAYFSHYRNTVKFQGRGQTEGYGEKVDTSKLRQTISELIGLEVKNLIGINLPTRMELKNSVASANLFYFINNEYLLPTYLIIDELIKLYSKKEEFNRISKTGATIDVSKIGGALEGYKKYNIYDKEHSWKYHNVWTGILRAKQRSGDRDAVARAVGQALIGHVMVNNLTLNFDFRELANSAYSLAMR